MQISRRSFIPMLGTALIGVSCLSIQDDQIFNELPSKTILPPRLEKGDTIGICAPAGGTKNKEHVYSFKRILESQGFNVILGENVFSEHGYFSAPDEERASGFMSLIENPTVKAIFFTRGGWGCARILQHLDFGTIQQHPKIIMGFSDITTLLNAISVKTGIVTFHGPGGNSSWNDFSWETIQLLLSDKKMLKYSLPDRSLLDNAPETIVSGIAQGQLYGGNLSVLSGLLGSNFLPEWKGKILFLEDVMEEPYRIDRMLTHFSLNGIFEQVNGIVLGQFRKCIAEEPERSFTLQEVFDQHFSKLNIPVFSGAAIGHIRYKHTIPVGMEAKINADNKTIELMHSAVL